MWGDGKHGDGTEPAGHNNTVFPAPAAVNGKACRPAARPLTAVVAGKSCQYDRQEESRGTTDLAAGPISGLGVGPTITSNPVEPIDLGVDSSALIEAIVVCVRNGSYCIFLT